MAGNLQSPDLAASDRIVEPFDHVNSVAAGSQWFHPSGSWLPRRSGKQKRERHPYLSASGRELPALSRRPLPAQSKLRQRDRLRQTEALAVSEYGSSYHALH